MDEIRVCLALAVAEYENMGQFSEHYGINNGNLSQVLSGKKSPQLAHLDILGICRCYEQKRAPR